MTGYHIRIGYNGARRTDYDVMCRELVAVARQICDNPPAIIAEARRLGAPESCTRGCCDLDTYADNYADDFDSDSHPVRIVAGEEGPEIVQLASTDDPIKYHVRRAFCRLVIEAMHRREIEVSLVVA